jgi:hypothetical protein
MRTVLKLIGGEHFVHHRSSDGGGQRSAPRRISTQPYQYICRVLAVRYPATRCADGKSGDYRPDMP